MRSATQRANGLVDALYREEEIMEAIEFPTATLCMFALGFCTAVGRRAEGRAIADAYKQLFTTDGSAVLREINPLRMDQ
jgi:hypothetical protein